MKDYSGQKFNNVTFVGFSHMKGTHSYWNCVCDCGKNFTARADCVTSGNTKSCGCLVKTTRHIEHGYAKTKLYHVYYSMRTRCYNAKDKSYKHYGARGISIYPAWLSDYKSFHEWAMNNGYREGLSIDRIDVNGNYEPSNCRWVDCKTQCRNTRRNTHITINGKEKLLVEWCELYNVNMATACYRIKRGLPMEKVFNISEKSVSTNCTPSIGTTGEAED